MSDTGDKETGAGADLRRLQQDVEGWIKWATESRDRHAQEAEANVLLEMLELQKSHAMEWTSESPLKGWITQRCEELKSEMHDCAHRYGLRLNQGRDAGGPTP